MSLRLCVSRSAATLALCFATSVALAAGLGSKVEQFTLPDSFARDRSLAEFKDAKAVVVAFLGAECPMARLYGPRLQELSEEYAARGVAFVGIDSNSQDTLTDIANFTRLYGVKFPVLKDRDGSVLDQFGAVRNPSVFLLDQDRVIRYAGRVDDQYGLGASAGYAKTVLKERSLGNAIDEVLAGKPVTLATTEVTGCIIGRQAKTTPKGDVTYTKHIAAIMQNRCVECHREGQVAPFTLTDYEQAAGWAAMMREVVDNGRMPPWSANPEFGHFGNDPRLSDAEKQQLFTWIDNGCPQGDPKDLPAPRKWVEGWRIPKPDQIVSMEKPFHVPAEGTINYQNFVVDPGWTEDKWIEAAEVQPGAYGNVHHIIVSVMPNRAGLGGAIPNRFATEEGVAGGAEPAERGRQPRERTGQASTAGLDAAALAGGRVSAFIPGRNPTIYEKGTAIYCPAGSKLVFQMHYTTNGKEADDISRVGMIFADPKDVKYIAYTAGAGGMNIQIPPYADNHKVEGEVTFAKETQLIVLHPHMHLRGKSMRFEALYPDGGKEILLDVPKYDPNWQFEYELASPKRMPAGTKMHVTGTFDNSENNPMNPDPSKLVTWGPQTWDEMMIGFYTMITPREEIFAARAKADQ